MAETTATQERGRGRPPAGLAKFTVEFGGPFNFGEIMVVSLARKRLRASWKKQNQGAKLHPSMNTMPDIPGAHLTVEPMTGKGLIYDPAEKDKDLWRRVNACMQKANEAMLFRNPSVMGPFESEPQKFTADQLKTLLYELIRMSMERRFGSKEANKEDETWGSLITVVKGRLPTEEQVDALPGRQLYDPGATGFRGKPKYVDQVDKWYEKLEQGAEV